MSLLAFAHEWRAAESQAQLRDVVKRLVAALRLRTHDAGAMVRLAHLAQFAGGRLSSFRGIDYQAHPIAAVQVACNLHQEGRRDLSARLLEAALRRLETADDDGRA